MKFAFALLTLMLAMLLPSARAEEKLVSPTLKKLFLAEVDQLVSTQKFPPGTSVDSVKAQIGALFDKYLMVTADDEERLKRGEVDEALNRKRMAAQLKLMDCFAIDRPSFTRKYTSEWKASTLNGMRLEVALRLNQLFFEKMAQATKMPQLATPDRLTVSDTLLRELTVFTNELLQSAVQQGERPPAGVSATQWQQAAMQPLMYTLIVTEDEEAQFKRGQFDEAANNKTLDEQIAILNGGSKAKAAIPNYSQKTIDEHKAGTLGRVRLELAVRMNKIACDYAQSVLDKSK